MPKVVSWFAMLANHHDININNNNNDNYDNETIRVNACSVLLL